jgi:aminoglycoside phosphotransferase (APT) family kinase protein
MSAHTSVPAVDLDEAEAEAMARGVIRHYFGSEPTDLVRKGGGLNNFVFAADHPEGAFVVRMSPNAAKINDYLREQWALGRARGVGVPTPEVLLRGRGGGGEGHGAPRVLQDAPERRARPVLPVIGSVA